jgi:hypothetical protein
LLCTLVMHHPSFSRGLFVLLVAAAFAACADPEGSGNGDPAGPEIATETQAVRSTVKVAINAVLITDFPVPLGCAGLNGSVFIPDISGHTNGTTITSSDCHWNAPSQLCECTVTFSQR